MKGYTAVRIFRGAVYNITVTNNGGTTPKLTVDGKPAESSIVPFVEGKTTYNVEVTM